MAIWEYRAHRTFWRLDRCIPSRRVQGRDIKHRICRRAEGKNDLSKKKRMETTTDAQANRHSFAYSTKRPNCSCFLDSLKPQRSASGSATTFVSPFDFDSFSPFWLFSVKEKLDVITKQIKTTDTPLHRSFCDSLPGRDSRYTAWIEKYSVDIDPFLYRSTRPNLKRN